MSYKRDKLEVILGEIRDSKRILHQPEMVEELSSLKSGVTQKLLVLESLINTGKLSELLQWIEVAERHGDLVALQVLVGRACQILVSSLNKQREKYTSFELRYLGSLIELAKESVKADRRINIVKSYPVEEVSESEEELEE